MDFVFVSFYFSEQFLFLVLYYTQVIYRELWVGIIVLSVITTASLDKLMMYSRQKSLGKIINIAIVERNDLVRTLEEQDKEIRALKSDNRIMNKILSEDL